MTYLLDSYHKLPIPIRRGIRKIIASRSSIIQPAQEFLYPRLARAQSLLVTRERRDQCWCGGNLKHFNWHKSYGICAECGTYVNRVPPAQKDLTRFYSLQNYWRARQRLKRFPTIENRGALYKSDGRVKHWLGLIEKYAPKSGTVIEVGCAPGILLQELSARNYDCIGVEINDTVAEWMRRETGINIQAGFFPGVDLPLCNVFLAFDVLEHSPCPVEFLQQAARLLLPNGVAIIQTAIDRYDYQPPFGPRFDIFDDLEHLFLFTDDAIKRLAAEAGLEIVSLQERPWLAGEVCVFRKA